MVHIHFEDLWHVASFEENIMATNQIWMTFFPHLASFNFCHNAGSGPNSQSAPLLPHRDVSPAEQQDEWRAPTPGISFWAFHLLTC